MRIAIITQNFLPEMGALPNRMYPFAQELAAAGHVVFVVTGMPNYPRGIVFPEYKGKLLSKEQFDNYTVLRSAYYPVARNKSKWSQALSYLSFLPGAFWNGVRAGKVDVVLVTSPPLFVSLPALLLAKLRGARLICDIRDLWPDEIVACGAASERSLSVRVVRALERLIYTQADCICCTTRSFIETVIERGADPEKAVYLPNGADLSLFRPLPADNPVAARFPMQNRFVVMYCGALGMKHGLLAVLEAAKLVEAEKEILFAFVGAGASEGDLRARAEQMHLSNVLFLGEQKVTDVPSLIARADVCISCLAPSAYFDKIISVKLFEYLACGKPVIGLHSGETARVLNESGAGIVVTPGDSFALAEAIRALYRDSEQRAQLGSRGRGYVEQHFSRRAIAMRLNALVDESPAPVMQKPHERERAGEAEMSRNFDLLHPTGRHTSSESLTKQDLRHTAIPHSQNRYVRPPAAADESDWLYVWSMVFRKHWRLSAMFAGGCVGAVLLMTLLMNPIYEPTARLEISPPGAELFRLERQNQISTDAEYLETQAREIESDDLAVTVIRAMDLAHNKEFMSQGRLGRLLAHTPFSRVFGDKRENHATTTRALTLSPEENAALQRFQDSLMVKRDTASRLVTVSFASPDPALAADITNTLVKLFVERCYQARHDAIMQSTQWLSRQLDDIRARMEQSNRAVVEFQRANGIADVDKDRSTVTDNLAELSRQKTQAETDRIQLEAYLRKVRDGNLEALPQIQGNPVVQQLSQKLAETRAELAQANTLLGNNHPTVQKLRRGVNELQTEISLQQKAILAQLRTSYAAALSRERMIGGEMQGASKQLNQVAEYASLKREAQTNTDLYNSLYAKVKEAGIATASNSSNIRVVDQARVLDVPTRPKLLANLGLGLAVSMVGFFTVPFLRERLTNRLRDVNDVRRWTGLSSIAAVPLAAGEGRGNLGGLLLSRDGRAAENDRPARFLLRQPQSPQAEALRGVETALMLSTLASPPQVVLVASSIPGEGKTTVVINLATALGRHGRTCIIDADLRRSKVASSFNLLCKTGLAQYLTGTDEIQNVMFAAPEVANVTVIPAGSRVQDPGTLICSNRMRELVQSLRRDYDYILIDSPPILLYADGRALSPLVDGVIFVARVGTVNREALVRSMELLNDVHSAPILQIVVNGADEVAQAYSRYYARPEKAS